MRDMSLLGLASSRRDETAPDPVKADHQIQLVDHTADDEDDHAPTSSGAESPVSPASSKPPRRLNRASIREDLAKRGLARHKYAKWQQDRYISEAEGSASGELVQINTKSAQLSLEEAEQHTDSSGRDDRVSRTKSKLERGRNRVKGFVGSKRAIKQAREEDAVVDVLFENQRGSFFFGIPLFSSKSLLNFDPSPWVNGKFKPSAVNITNAAVPDPSWEWVWPSWYVDMSLDVDEEGWQYSFSFNPAFSWHGTHPLFHSFVRRRCWLRKRVRKHSAVHGQPNPQHMSEAHMLNAEYFTIHPKPGRSRFSSSATSPARSASFTRFRSQEEDQDQEDEIKDVSTLLKRLKRAAIDREKIVDVRRFLDEGGEELYYLAEEMPVIMSLLVFQSSRRQLLALLLRHFEAASTHRQEHLDHHQRESSAEARKIDNLLKALRAADEECRKLEYWSDIRGMTQGGESLYAADSSMGWDHGWDGVDDSGPGVTDEGGAERFKEDGKPARVGFVDADLEAADEVVKNTEEHQANGQGGHVADDEQHTNGSTDKGKGKAE